MPVPPPAPEPLPGLQLSQLHPRPLFEKTLLLILVPPGFIKKVHIFYEGARYPQKNMYLKKNFYCNLFHNMRTIMEMLRN